MIPIQCPSCGFRKEGPDEFRGRQVKCLRCGTMFTIAGGTGRRRGLLLGVLGLLVLGAIGTGAYFVFMVEEPAKAPSRPQVAKAPETPREASIPAKEPKEDSEAKLKAEELAKKKEAERVRLEQEEKRKQEEVRLAKEAEEKKERERLAKLAKEEMERKERAAKEEAARLLFEKRNPKVSAAPEDVDAAPQKYLGKRLYIEGVRLKENAIDKSADLGLYTLGVTSASGKYFSRVIGSDLFFSAGNDLVLPLRKEWNLVEQFPRVRLYCEIRNYEKKKTGKSLPEAHIFKVELRNRQGEVVKVWEEPE
jgi:hypothetical protein